ncbi:MAG: hypothetical protein ACP5KN_16420, partial [Armatimonadota bacterium]
AYPSYIEMAKLLRREYPEKGFFPYVAGKFGLDEGSVRFAEACTAADGMICREAYLAEWPTLPQALDYMRRAPERMLFQFEGSLPDVTFETVWVPGTFSFPWPFADGFPQCNYNAYLDMQFQMLATHPAFFGLGGVHIWRSGYTDEERLRWIGRFFEHYCIEGNTSRVTADPYVLEHIANPDFTEGLDGWTVQPAAEGSIEAGEREGLGSLQGRHYRGNDTFALMERSAERPNVLRQTVTGLRVGRTYSAKVLFGDYGDLLDGTSRNARHSLSVRLDGVELIEGGKYAYHEVYPTRARVGQFTREHPYFVNMRWQVFRATSTTTTLTISDWASPDEPGGPAGQRLWMNFIEVKPYLMD